MLGLVVRRSFPHPLAASLVAAFAACAAFAAFLWPALAWACPACAGTETTNATFLKVGSLFVLLPFAIVGLVLYVLRNAPRGA
jgi:hypothetical protein